MKRPIIPIIIIILLTIPAIVWALHDSFPDVPRNHPHAASIHWATEKAWFHGYEDGTFRPDEQISPEHAVIVLRRAFEDTGLTRGELATVLVYGIQALNEPEIEPTDTTLPITDDPDPSTTTTDPSTTTTEPEHRRSFGRITDQDIDQCGAGFCATEPIFTHVDGIDYANYEVTLRDLGDCYSAHVGAEPYGDNVWGGEYLNIYEPEVGLVLDLVVELRDGTADDVVGTRWSQTCVFELPPE